MRTGHSYWRDDMKILLIVLDGAADLGENTPYRMAKKPNIDKLASKGVVGMLDFGYKKSVDSDLGFLKLLGVYDEKEYPGRGFFDALGAGLETRDGIIYVRGNFATLDDKGNVIDRRAGRNEEGLDELAGRLDGMEIDHVKFSVHHALGHRAIVEMEGKNLSRFVTSNDSRLTNVPLMQIKPLNVKAKFTASVLNKFTYRAIKILREDPINAKRKPPANLLLTRSLGTKNETRSFDERYGVKGCVICAHMTAWGIAKYLGMEVIHVPNTDATPNTNLRGKIDATAKALKTNDFVWLHINGTDMLSHDRKRQEKAKFIEKIDENLGILLKSIDIDDTIIALTSDHTTCSLKDFKGYEHQPDPVPFLISGGGISPDHVEKFDEESCKKGFLKLKGNGLMKKIIEYSEK